MDPSNKGTMAVTTQVLNYLNRYRHGSPSIKTLNENIQMYFMGLRFPDYSPFYEEFNEKIHDMISSGLIEYFRSTEASVKKADDDVGPQVLTFQHLRMGFIFCLVPLGISAVVFLGEILVHVLRKSC